MTLIPHPGEPEVVNAAFDELYTELRRLARTVAASKERRRIARLGRGYLDGRRGRRRASV